MRLFGFMLLAAILPALSLANDLTVTVYNSDLGVVSDTRTLDFEKGAKRLSFKDVPSKIDVNSVRLSVVGGRNVSILEQNYAFDLVNPAQIYTRYIDKQIELVDKEGRLYNGVLLSSGGNNVVLRDMNGGIKIIRMENITEVNFPSLPDGLITRPTLFWLYESDFSGAAEAQVSYQTGGMSWTAEYVGLLSSDEKNLDVSGWAAINNTSGKTYRDASLKLVAGEINRAPRLRPRANMDYEMSIAKMPPSAGFEEKAFFEYHLYTLPRRATLANKEVKQISLFEPARTGVKKRFIYRPDRDAKHVEVGLKFVNSTENGMGMPLPAGRVRLFKADDDGAMILLGEDRINHTPRNEEVTLKIGTVFDIVCEEKIIQQNRISQLVEEREYLMEFRNRKDVAVEIEIIKRHHGSWEIVSADFKYAKKDAFTLTATIKIEAGQTRTLKYKVRFNYR